MNYTIIILAQIQFTMDLTLSRVSQLPADHLSISVIPSIITHSAPAARETYLHTSLIQRGATNQSYAALYTLTTCTESWDQSEACIQHLKWKWVIRTSNSCIFMVKTVVLADSVLRTVEKSCLRTCTSQIIQENGATPLTKVSPVESLNCCRTECKIMRYLSKIFITPCLASLI